MHPRTRKIVLIPSRPDPYISTIQTRHTLLLDSYESLTTRDEPIGMEEGVKLGLRTSLQIARAREMSRGPDTGGGLRSPSAIQLTPSDLRSLLSDIFRIQTNGAAYTGPFTAPVNHSDKLDRASALPAVSANCIFFFKPRCSDGHLYRLLKTVPATPYKPEALSQSASTSEENRPTNNTISIKMPAQDTTKGNPRTKKLSSTSRWPNSWGYL
jgi:hypothetical protein